MRPKPWTAHGTADIDGVVVSAEAAPMARARMTAENLAILKTGGSGRDGGAAATGAVRDV